MAHVRALFRVLHVDHDHSGMLTVEVAPTHATRDGVEVLEHKRFWDATPSGKGELKVGQAVSDAVRMLFAPGAYVYLDLIDSEEDIIGQAAGAIRTDWQIDEVVLRPADFRVKLSPVVGQHVAGSRDNGRNAVVFGARYDCGSIEMSINNLEALPFFAFTPTKGAKARQIVIDFSPG